MQVVIAKRSSQAGNAQDSRLQYEINSGFMEPFKTLCQHGRLYLFIYYFTIY